LSSYSKLTPADGRITKAALNVDRDAVLQAHTVRILPAVFSPEAAATVESPEDRRLVTNTINRALCIGLSDRFEIVDRNTPADLTVRATVTNVVATDATIAGVSTAVSLGSQAVLPVSAPRLPFGLGGLAVEAEALGRDKSQKAAMLWARGANSITERARMSKVGDAYSLASDFGSDFAQMLVTGESPFGASPSLPSVQKISANFGGEHKYAPCEAFGRSPGVVGLVTGQLGLPPEWSDKGSVPAK
jgi:hypothetical protein